MRRSPNILLILSDQEQHWDHLPADLRRDGMAQLQEMGTTFTNHHVVTLPCGPSRSTIYTGQHTAFTGVHSNPSRARGVGMSPTVPTIGGMLREIGYHTAYKGKWHVSVVDPPTPFSASAVHALEEFGFAEFNADGDPVGVAWDGYRRDPSIASDAANWLLGRSGGKPDDAPWFLAVNFVNPHDVMFFDATGSMNRDGTSAMPRLPAPLSPRYETFWDVDLPVSFDDDLATKPSVQQQIAAFTDAVLGLIPHENTRAWRALRSYYLNCLRDLDANLCTVLAALRESGHARDTVVIYTTDHGEAAGAHGLREKPTSLYREVVNVPLVIAHPDVAGGSATDALSSALDVVPTLLAFAGGQPQPQLHGFDLTPAIAGGRTERDGNGVLFSSSRPPLPASGPEVPSRSYLRGWFDGRWKFGRYFAAQDAAPASDPERLFSDNDLELYDTANDPDELRNLAYDPACADALQTAATALTMLMRVETPDGMDTPSSICHSDSMQNEDGRMLDLRPAGSARHG